MTSSAQYALSPSHPSTVTFVSHRNVTAQNANADAAPNRTARASGATRAIPHSGTSPTSAAPGAPFTPNAAASSTAASAASSAEKASDQVDRSSFMPGTPGRPPRDQ